jgi:hypothetical protein
MQECGSGLTHVSCRAAVRWSQWGCVFSLYVVSLLSHIESFKQQTAWFAWALLVQTVRFVFLYRTARCVSGLQPQASWERFQLRGQLNIITAHVRLHDYFCLLLCWGSQSNKLSNCRFGCLHSTHVLEHFTLQSELWHDLDNTFKKPRLIRKQF